MFFSDSLIFLFLILKRFRVNFDTKSVGKNFWNAVEIIIVVAFNFEYD